MWPVLYCDRQETEGIVILQNGTVIIWRRGAEKLKQGTTRYKDHSRYKYVKLHYSFLVDILVLNWLIRELIVNTVQSVRSLQICRDYILQLLQTFLQLLIDWFSLLLHYSTAYYTRYASLYWWPSLSHQQRSFQRRVNHIATRSLSRVTNLELSLKKSI